MLHETLAPYVQIAPIISTKATCKQALDCLRMYPLAEGVIVVNEDNHVAGLLQPSSLYLKLTSGYGIENLYNKPITTLMLHRPLLANASLSLAEILQQFITSDAESFVIVHQLTPIGIISREVIARLKVSFSPQQPPQQYSKFISTEHYSL